MMKNNKIFSLVSTIFGILSILARTINVHSVASYNTDKTDWTDSLVSSCCTSDFKLYWAVGTMNCHEFGLNFSEVSEKFGIIQNHDDYLQGEKVAGTLFQPVKKNGYQMDNFAHNFSGLGIMRLYPCPKNLTESVFDILSDVQRQRPNATWTLNDYPCSTDQFKDISRITSDGRSSSPLVTIMHKEGKQAALSRIEDYVGKLEQTIMENEMTPRIIINFWMTFPGGSLFSKFGPYFAYDVMKIFLNHGFCEVSLMATGAAVTGRKNCEKFHQYLNNDFGPGVRMMRENLEKIGRDRCFNEQSTSTTQPSLIPTVPEVPKIQLPPPKNY